MAIKPTVDQFLSILRRSGLIPPEQISGLVDLFASREIDVSDSLVLAEAFVKDGLISQWQADKLIQGKHRGFFLGNYRLTSLLGTGGMSSVYLAEHVMMRRQCAIKVLPAKKAKDTSYLARFQREAQVVASLDHPNIVRAYDVDKDFDRASEIHFLVMEYVDGRSLQEMVEDEGAFDFTLAADCIRQAAEGLHHAHQAGLVHRDVKPSNLLLNESGTLKILDLGLARFFTEEDKDSLTVAHDEKVLGTADYLAPEQALDSHNVDFRADIYALGCTFYYLMLGHPPYPEGTLAQRLMAHQTKEPLPIEKSRPNAPNPLVDLIRRMMVRDPDRRIASARDVSDQIVIWLRDHGDEKWKETHSALIGSSFNLKSNHNESEPRNDFVTADNRLPEKFPDRERQPSKKSDQDLNSFLSNLSKSDNANSTPTKSNLIESDPVKSGQKNFTLEQSAEKKNPEFELNLTLSEKKNAKTKGVSKKKKTPTSRPNVMPVSQKRQGKKVPIIASESPLDLDKEESIVKSDFSLVEKLLQPIRQIYEKLGVYNSILLVVTLLTLGAVISWKTQSNPQNSTEETETEKSARNGEDGTENGLKRKTGTQNRSAVRTLNVGPDAEYRTISAALKFASDEFQPRSSRDVLTIEVEGGNIYKETLVIDNSQSVFGDRRIRIVSKGKQPALLQAEGTEAVVRLIEAHYITLEGFEVDCNGLNTGVELSGFCTGTKLKNLKIRDFKRSGVVGKSLQGFASPIYYVSFEGLRFSASAPAAAGFRFFGETSRVSISNCVFLGSFMAGVEFKQDARFIRISQCRFAGLTLGIRFNWNRPHVLKELEISNNTFYLLQHGLHWSRMPDDSSDSLNMFSNLFVGSRGPDAVVTVGYQANKFRGFVAQTASTRGRSFGFQQNWTSRKTTTPTEILMLFQQNGHRGLQYNFRSTEPSNESFLLPTNTAQHRQVGANQLGKRKS